MELRKKKIQGKPRLLIVLNRFVIGGQAVDTLPLAYFLNGDFQILILYGEKEKDEVEPEFLLKKYPGLQQKKIDHLRRSLNPLNDIIAFARLVYIIVRFKPQIVHTHGAKSGFLGRFSAWVCNVPVIVHTFHGHFFHSYFSKKVSRFVEVIERQTAKITTAAVALSIAQEKELVEEYKILPASKVAIIPLGFDYEIKDRNSYRDTFRNKYGLQKNDIAIGIIGRIVPIKNHLFFIRVIKNILLTRVSSRAAFFIIGDGYLRRHIEDALIKEGILFSDEKVTPENRVIFTSWITNMYEVMNGLDIVTLTSLNEGTPLSIIEAQFFKRPVVSTNVGGVKDTMEDARTGFLIQKDDVESFCEKVTLLITNEDLRVKMGEEGHKLVVERFSKKKEVEKTKEFYFSLLRQKGFYLLF